MFTGISDAANNPVKISRICIGVPAVIQGLNEAGIEADRLVIVGDGSGEIATMGQGIAAVEEGDRAGLLG
jgi:hypothetical protein